MYLFCLVLLPFDLLSFVTGTPSAKAEESLVEYELQQNSETINAESSDEIKNKLWLADITPAKEDINGGKELKLLIEKIRTIDLIPQKHIPEDVNVPEEKTVDEPNDKETEVIELNKEKKKEIVREIPNRPVTDLTLKKLMELAQQPEKIQNPFELGETLFLCDNLQEASIFYKEALERLDPNDIFSAQDRAWLLFKIGNCLRDYDMPAAKEMYGQLITEYPDLLWSNLAEVQNNLIGWRSQNKPNDLIKEYSY